MPIIASMQSPIKRVATGSAGGGASYTPQKLISFESGVLGAQAQGANSFVSAHANTLFSDAVSGPFGGSRVCKIEGQNVGGTVFGGVLSEPNVRPAEGSGIWIRIWHHFPSTFCFQNNGLTINNDADAWGGTKWIRVQWGGGTTRMTFQMSNYSSTTCNTYGEMYGATNEGIGADIIQNFPSQLQVARGGWRCLEWHVHFSESAAVGYIEGWVDGAHCGRKMCVTMPASLNLTEIHYGDYINGGHILNNPWYIDEGIITLQTPDAIDAGGRPFIGTTRSVGDFA